MLTDSADGVVIAVNAEFIRATGYAREEAVGRSPLELRLLAGDDQQSAEILRQLRDTGEVRNVEIVIRCKNGDLVPTLLSIGLVEFDGRQCRLYAARNITALKKTERDLVEAREAALDASRAKSEFLSSMSHEIRTPLNAVLGMAELLAETELDGEQRRFLDVMNANSIALLELINSILDLAKIESGRLQIENIDFELAELVDKTIATFGIRAHSKGLELAARIAPGVPEYLNGDPHRLRQVLVNLVGNALKFTEVGEVVLMIENDPEDNQPGMLRFTVADTGIGIAPDNLEAIFSSFTQADSSTTRRYGGTGLGLSIAQRLTVLMGGKIWLESELGHGSKFIFTVPFELASTITTATSIALPDLAGYRVLIVEITHQPPDRARIGHQPRCGGHRGKFRRRSPRGGANSNGTGSADPNDPARYADARDGRSGNCHANAHGTPRM
jgi:PAS domain S-box-containing protein